jgi:predicted ABC-type ATPase
MKNKSRVRIFAGPNGSGKSTMKTLIKDELLGFYIRLILKLKISNLL